MTLRALALWVGCALLMLGGAVAPVLLPIGIVAFAVLLLAMAADVLLAPGVEKLGLSVDVPEKAGVGYPFELPLHAAWKGTCRVRIELPPEILTPDLVKMCSFRNGASPVFVLTARRRGVFVIPRILAHVPGPLRLMRRQRSVTLTQPIEVDVDIDAVRRYGVLSRRGTHWAAGATRLKLSVEGTAFERIREAQVGDSLRVINWAATARTGKLMASEYLPERSQDVIIAIDHGRLMGVGAGILTKFDLSLNAAFLLASTVVGWGDNVGGVAFSREITASLPPRPGRSQLPGFLSTFRAVRPEEIETDYESTIPWISSWRRRRSLIMIFTDVDDPRQGEELVRQCAQLKRHMLPLVIMIRDPEIVDLASTPPDSPSRAYELLFLRRMLEARNAVTLRLERLGIDVIDVDARELSPQVVSRYFLLKERALL